MRITAWHKIKFLQLAAHLIAVAGLLFAFDVAWLCVSFAAWVLVYGYGTSIGYHRLWTHKAFNTSKFVKYSTLFVGIFAGFGSVVGWVGMHRQHHAYSDVSKELDPNWAHDDYSFIGTVKAWALTPRPIHFGPHLVKDLLRDKLVMFTYNHYFKILVTWLLCLLLISPMAFIYLGAMPMVLAYTSAQISGVLGHRIGDAEHDIGDRSKDCHWLSLLCFGETYQNVHHKYPAQHNLGICDMSGLIIDKLLIKR